MASMFQDNTSLNVPLYLQTEKVYNMDYMFQNAETFNQYLDSSASYWNTSLVTSMSNMFYNAFAFNNGGRDLSLNTYNVQNMNYMFFNDSSLNVNIYFNTSQVTNMESMFQNAITFNKYLNNTGPYWNTEQVKNMDNMFNNATVFNNTDIDLSFNTTNLPKYSGTNDPAAYGFSLGSNLGSHAVNNLGQFIQ